MARPVPAMPNPNSPARMKAGQRQSVSPGGGQASASGAVDNLRGRQ